MDQFFHECDPQNGNQQTIKNKKRLNQDQVKLLETNFSLSNRLEPERKAQLALQLGLPPRQVAVWYQNKRAREKNQSLEDDHKALQLRLDSVVAENFRLKGEVDRLKAELNKIQGMLSTFNSSVSTSGDEVGSSNLFVSKQNNLESELYASLMDRGGGQFAASDGCDFFSNSS